MDLRRYLQPEPMWLEPQFVESEAKGGQSLPAYSYAYSNPMTYVDPTGLYSWGVMCDSEKEGKGGFLGITPPSVDAHDRCQDCWRTKDYVEWVCKNFAKFCSCARKLEKEVCDGVTRFSCPAPEPKLTCEDTQLVSR